jgi:hypothetical protein
MSTVGFPSRPLQPADVGAIHAGMGSLGGLEFAQDKGGLAACRQGILISRMIYCMNNS